MATAEIERRGPSSCLQRVTSGLDEGVSTAGTLPAVPKSLMPITLEYERDNVFRLDLRGTLRQTELEVCQQRLLDEMARTGPVRLLFVLDGFEGWDPDARWNDLSFYVRHGDQIERIAIVGPERWRSETLMFAGADLRKAPVEFFVEGAISQARAWLAS